MTSKRHRKLSNVVLTRRYHFPYLGLWVLLTVALIITVNTLMYLLMEERWAGLASLSSSYHEEYITFRALFRVSLLIECLLFSLGMVLFARFTAHRIAGPFIRMQKVFQAIEEGNYRQRLKFREYDRLGVVEESFNGMMDVLHRHLRTVEKMPEHKP